MWAFFEPLHLYVWMALLGTIIVTPFFVFFFEAVFSKWMAYLRGEQLHVVSGLRECLWHSISHTLSIDVFKVRSLPARIVTAAYAFLVLILTNTYTANLAAFLTVDQLDTTISSVSDLRGKAVATVEPYINRLYRNHRIIGSSADGWEYGVMVDKLRQGEYAAVISDDTQLIGRAYSDASCSLHILGDMIEPFDLALAFRRNFPSTTFRAAVSSALLDMQEDGTLSELKEEHQPPEPKCISEATEFSETNQVEVSSLWGLWIILGVAVLVAALAGVVEYTWKRRKKHEDVQHINERVQQIRAQVGGPSMHRAASAFWSTLERPRRGGAVAKPAPSLGGPLPDLESGPSGAAPANHAPKPEGALWNRAALVASQSLKRGSPDVLADAAAAVPCSPGAGRSGKLKRQITRPPSLNVRDSAGAASAAADALVRQHSSDGDLPARAAGHSSSAGAVLQPWVRPAVSRQASMGSTGLDQGGGPGAAGSLCVCSTGARSDILDDAAEDTLPEHEGSGHGGPSGLQMMILPALPHACQGSAVGGLGGGRAPRDALAADLPTDMDAELVQLNSVVQAVAQRVSTLCQVRRQVRRQSSQR